MTEFENLIRARDNRSVLKIRLINSLACSAGRMVFAFEGDDDKVVFSHWIFRLRPALEYESFVGNGKRNLRLLSCIVADDASNIRNQVAIFVDRDFDDLSDFCEVPWIFMTDRYSIENYLVDEAILNCSLRAEFPLEGEPQIRDAVLSRFRVLYGAFLEITRDANLRLFVARREQIDRHRSFNSKRANVVQVTLDGVEGSAVSLAEALPLVREPSGQEIDRWRDEFLALDPCDRYRGKFALQFFRSFLRLLCDACRNGTHELFENVARPNIREAEHNIGNFAARSQLPSGLDEFLAALPD